MYKKGKKGWPIAINTNRDSYRRQNPIEEGKLMNFRKINADEIHTDIKKIDTIKPLVKHIIMRLKNIIGRQHNLRV